MRNRFLLVAGILLTLGLFASQAPKVFSLQAPGQMGTEDAARKAAALMQSASPAFLTPQEVHALMQAGVPVRLGDVRKASFYARRHIQGALSVPRAELSSWGPKLSRKELVVLYCT